MVYFRPCTGASDIVKRKYCFNEEEIESLQSEGRGKGVGREYFPWILAHQVNSIGPTSRAARMENRASPSLPFKT